MHVDLQQINLIFVEALSEMSQQMGGCQKGREMVIKSGAFGFEVNATFPKGYFSNLKCKTEQTCISSSIKLHNDVLCKQVGKKKKINRDSDCIKTYFAKLTPEASSADTEVALLSYQTHCMK